MEHRYDREDGVGGVQRQDRAGDQRVDGDRAMRVDDPLRQAGRPAREAHRRGRVLVDVTVGERALVGPGEKLLEVDCAVRRLAGADRDHVLEADPSDELLGERPEDLVDHEHAVARMRGDVRVVVRVQAKVQRMRDEAAGRCPDVCLEMLVVVPHECPDPVAVLETEAPQRHCQALRARREVGVRVAVPALVRESRDDFAVAVELLGAAEDRRDVELVVHHQALHRTPPSRSENPQKRILAA